MRSTATLAVILLALTACDDGAGPAGDVLSETEVVALSEAMAVADFTLTGETPTGESPADGVALDPVTATTEFTTTRTCPAGGRVVVEGTRTRTWDRDTHSGTSDLALTKTHEACARVVGDVTITVDGDPNIALNAHHAWEDGARVGLQTLSLLGAFTWSTDDGREGRCTIEVNAVFDPATSTRTVAGTVCDRTFERTTTWTGGHHGGMSGG